MKSRVEQLKYFFFFAKRAVAIPSVHFIQDELSNKRPFATTIAFATGLYTVLAAHLQWLAIMICLLVALLPVLTKLLGEWPILKLKFRLGKSFKTDILDMV